MAASSRERLVVAGVAAVAFAIRAPGALRDAFWQDEVSSARIVRLASPVSTLRQVARGEATPPLWYLGGSIAHVFGVAPGGYRWLSVLCGALAAGLVVVLALRVVPLWAAAFAGLIAALGWELVMHGRELRAYAAFELLATLLPLALLRATERRDRGSLALLAVVVAAGTMTNYFFVLGVAAALLWLWLDRREVARRTTLWIALGLAPLVLWSPALVHQYRAQRFAWIGPFSLRRLVDAPWLLFVHHVPHGALATTAPLLFAVVLLAGTAALLARGARLYAALLVVPFALVTLAWLGGAHVFASRNLVGVAPFAAIGCAALAASIPRPVGLVAAAAAVAALAFGSIRAEATAPPRYDDVAHALVAAGWTPRSPVVLLGNFFAFRSPLEWYLPHQPRLTLGLARENKGCRVGAFIVAQGPRNRARASSLARSAHTVGGIVVGRLSSSLPARTQTLAAAQARCVVLVGERRLIPTLRHLRGASA